MKPTNQFVVMSRRPKLFGKARTYGKGYRKFALCEIDPAALPPGATEPRMISERARGMIRIIRCRSLFYGEGKRSEGAAYLAGLRKQCALLNATAGIETAARL